MMRQYLRRPSAPMVVASGALLFSLTGTGLADIAQLGRNSVGTPQLRTGAVTTPKIRNGAVTTAKLRNRAITPAKLAPGARVPGPRGPAGPPGPAGPQGPPGAPVDLADESITTAKLANNAVTRAKLASGAVTAGKFALIAFRTNSTAVANGASAYVERSCEGGERALGGGMSWGGAFSNAQAQGTHVVWSRPTGNGYGGLGYNGSGSQRSLTAWTVCLDDG